MKKFQSVPEFKRFELKSFDISAETNEMFIEGHAAIFGNKDEQQLTYNPNICECVLCSDVITKGSFQKTLSDRASRVAFCLNHDLEEAMGKIVEIKEDETGLFVRIRISDAEPELKTKIKEGIYTEFSIGFKTIKAEFVAQADGTYVRNITEIKLYEISLVTIARNELAVITDVKSIESVTKVLNSLIENEKNETKQIKLMQLKSLLFNEPDYVEPLEKQKPGNKSIDKFEFNFK